VFKKPFDELFEEFGHEPIGVGAIAQVCKLYVILDNLNTYTLKGLPSDPEKGSPATLVLGPEKTSQIWRSCAHSCGSTETSAYRTIRRSRHQD
jgi:hypothetical protein